MFSLRNIEGAMLAATLAAGFAAPAFAAWPMAMHQGDITYVSGGIGMGQQRALEAQARHYNLAITNANRAGDFTTDTALVIRSKTGREILNVADTGPMFYAKLPPGDYVIHATNEGQQRTRDVNIASRGMTDLHLIWPQQG